MKKQFIKHSIRSTQGSGESSEFFLLADLISGETELVIEKTITERFPITEYGKCEELYEKINSGGGRILISLKDFAKR